MARTDELTTTPKGFRRFLHLLTGRLTVMLVPHSERNIRHFHVNGLVLISILLIFLGTLGLFTYLASIQIAASRVAEEQQDQLAEDSLNLDRLLSEVRDAVRVARSFDVELAETVRSLGIDPPRDDSPSGIGRGDLADFFDLEIVSEDDLREIQELQGLTGVFAGAVEPIQGMRSLLQARQNLLADIPNLWPVGQGFGRVSVEFGPNIHPVSGKWYLQKGIFIAGPQGTPVLASATGRVVEMGYDTEQGLYVVLRHNYGFRTRYSYLESILVREGQDVIQGEQIGTLGNTGISPGPHLNFVVMLGTDVVDPAAFLKIRSDGTPGGIVAR